MHDSRSPVIKKAPSKARIEKMVETLVEPMRADECARDLIELLTTVGNEADPETYELYQTACHRAYSMTAHFETAFRAFAGLVPQSAQPREESKIFDETEREQ